MKKIIHKIKWQIVSVEGWYIHPSQVRDNQCFRSLCSNIKLKAFSIKHKRWKRLVKHWGNGSVGWKNVTCKNCLKMRKQ
jgi:hypothetical protein